MKKVLVTGADGFIGSHLVELLVSKGYEVRALALYNSFNDWGWLENISCLDSIEVITGDVRDPGFCRHMVQDIDTIFNLAALIAIPYSYVAPDNYTDTNVKGAINICQAARDTGAKVIQISTSEVYGTALYVPIDEKHPLQPQSPYSASKIAADALAMSFFHSFDLPVVLARPFNTFGPRQSARAVIPTIITQLAAGKKRIQLGDLRPTRDFNFVADTCAALLALAECPAAVGKVVNIGSGREISIGDLFETLRELMNADAEVEIDSERLRPEKSEVQRLCCDASLLKKLTGFTPRFTLEEGLEETVQWFSRPENLKRYKTDIYNI